VITGAFTTVCDGLYRQRLLTIFIEVSAQENDKVQLSQLYHGLRRPIEMAELLIDLFTGKFADEPLFLLKLVLNSLKTLHKSLEVMFLVNYLRALVLFLRF
jgi:hypothetical protein